MPELILSLIWPKNTSVPANCKNRPKLPQFIEGECAPAHCPSIPYNTVETQWLQLRPWWLVFFDRVRASSFKFPVVPTNIPTLTWHWLQLNFSNVNMFSGVWTPNPKMSSHAKPSWITNLKLVANAEGKVKSTGSSWWVKDIWNQKFQSFRRGRRWVGHVCIDLVG